MINPKTSVDKIKKYDPPLEGRKNKLRLDFNENTLGCSPNVIKAIKKVTKEDLAAYPEYDPSIKRLSQFVEMKPTELLLTNGIDEAIKVIMETFLNKKDQIIIPTPTFAMFELTASIIGADIIKINYNKDLSFPTKKVLQSITTKTKMVVLVNPNNPTSSSIAKKNILSILKKAKNSIVLIDEAYFEFYGITAKNLLTRYKNLIITRTFSKAWGLAGLRLGYIISNKCIIANLQKVISHYSVNTLALTAMNAALSDTKYVKNYVKKVKASKQYLLKELKKLKIKTYPANANFVIADFGKKCNAVCNQLRKKNILVRNRSKYPLLQDCLRLGIGTLEQSKILINSIKDILRKKAILFDMDGVLVDVNQSYRLTIKKTVEYFTKQTVTNRDIQKLKEKSGFNNDWDLSEALILGRGVKISKNGVIQKFQSFYLGEKDTKGLINNEKWLLPKKTLTNLSQKYSIGIVTGRPKAEALYILKKFGVEKYFDTLIAMEDYPPSKAKPDPFSINLALKQLNCSAAVYLGDSLDDIIAAKRAGIQSIGIPPPGNSSKILNSLLKKNGADIVLKNCNKLTEVLQ